MADRTKNDRVVNQDEDFTAFQHASRRFQTQTG